MLWITNINWREVKDVATEESVPWRLLGAIIQVESGGESHATRYEDHYKYLFKVNEHASDNGITVGTEIIHQKTSWGAAQVMGAVAREFGFDDHLPLLCGKQSLVYACKLIKRLASKYNQREDIIASYNAGSPIKTTDGKYKNQEYVDKVMRAFVELEQLKGF